MEFSGPDLSRCLSALPLFEGVAPAALQRLAGAGRLQRVARRGMVFHMGDACAALSVVVAGQVKLFAVSAAGHEKVIELIGPGGALAEAPLFTGRPHPLSAQALDDTVLLTLDKARVLAEIGADPRLALRMLGSVSRRLHGLMQGVEADALHSGLQRVVTFLLRQHQAAPAGRPAVSLPASKATLASLLSLTPEYLSRVLRTLESAELIQVDRRDIRILDPQGLATCQSQQLQALAARGTRAPAAPALH